MADNLNSDNEFRNLKDRVRRLENTLMLQNSSISEGRMRFIGGLLRVDSGGRVEIVGTLQIDGSTIVTGTFDITGAVSMTGAVDITGPLTISGDVSMTGAVGIDGPLTVSGEWEITGDGEIAGNVSLTGDMEIAEGGTFKAGGITISEEEGGLVESDIQINIRTPALDIEGGVRVDQAAVFDGNVTMNNLIPIAQSEVPGSFVGAIMRDSAKRLRVVVGG